MGSAPLLPGRTGHLLHVIYTTRIYREPSIFAVYTSLVLVALDL